MPLLRPLSVTALIVLALVLGACGSESSTTGSQPDAAAGETARQGQKKAKAHPQPAPKQAGQQPAPKEPAHFTPPSHGDSGGGAEQFETKGGDNSIQEFGAEAAEAEFAGAAAALHAFLDARAARAWKAACEEMLPAVSRELVRQLGEGGGTCASLLATLTGAVPTAALREAAVADVGALRVEGERGFLLFEGANGQRFFMPMARDGGQWKVAAIAASPLL